MPIIYAFERGRNDVDSVYLLAGYCSGLGINDKFYNVFFFSFIGLVYNTARHFVFGLGAL